MAGGDIRLRVTTIASLGITDILRTFISIIAAGDLNARLTFTGNTLIVVRAKAAVFTSGSVRDRFMTGASLWITDSFCACVAIVVAGDLYA